MSITIGSLFSGIGGLELGLEWAGLGPVKWQVERDAFCRKVLAKHWPETRRFGDIGAVTEKDLESVDIICGGFPCQPHSLAGGRGGRSDERWLWPEFARIVRAVRPRFVAIENVPGLLTSDGGAAFGEVLSDLAQLGYDAWWDVLAAAEAGAPHKRNRLFVVAWLADTHGVRECESEGRVPKERRRPENGSRRASESGLGRSVNGLADWLDGHWPSPRNGAQAPWEPSRTTGKTKGRQARIKALGNAVVPQVAYAIGCVVQAMDQGTR